MRPHREAGDLEFHDVDFVDSVLSLAESKRFDRRMTVEGCNRRRERYVQTRRRPLACVEVRAGRWQASRATSWARFRALRAERGSPPDRCVRIPVPGATVE